MCSDCRFQFCQGVVTRWYHNWNVNNWVGTNTRLRDTQKQVRIVVEVLVDIGKGVGEAQVVEIHLELSLV